MTNQSQLAQLIVTPENNAEAIFVKIKTLSAIEAPTYLDGSNKVFKFYSIENVVLPTLIIECRLLDCDEDTHCHLFSSKITLRMRGIDSSKFPDNKRFERIIRPVISAIDGHGNLLLSGFEFFDSNYRTMTPIIRSDVVPQEFFQTVAFTNKVRSN